MSYIIRRLVVTDLDAYFQNRLEALKDSPSAFLSTYDEEVGRGNQHFKNTLSHLGNEKLIFGVVHDQKILGTIGIYKEEKSKLSHRAEIWGMYISPEIRGQGYGRKLLDVAISFAKTEMKVHGIGLSAESNNQTAIKLYESCGFKRWGSDPYAERDSDGKFLGNDYLYLIID